MSQRPTKIWTILEILRWTTGYFKDQGIDSARLDAELLLAQVLGLNRIELYTKFDRPLEPDERDEYRALVKRRANREPVAYILGRRDFWEFTLAVDPRVLIPRPDTETLVRAALELLPDDAAWRVVDVGTGSGAIALSLAFERPELLVGATDLSTDALEVARENAANHDLDDRIEFFSGDLLEAVPEDWTPLDIVVSNPPYIAESERDEMAPDVLDHEPPQALFAGPEGLDLIERLADQACLALRPGGYLLIEIGYRQGKAVSQLLAKKGFEDVQIHRDYGDRDRVVAARMPGENS